MAGLIEPLHEVGGILNLSNQNFTVNKIAKVCVLILRPLLQYQNLVYML
jgi:hypothetical protein